MIPCVCAEFHDAKGNILHSIRPADLRLVQDAPESIRQDPLYGMLLREGSIRVPESKEELKLLENEPTVKAQAPAAETADVPASDPAAAEDAAPAAASADSPAQKPSGRKSK